jgi:hypothetical protein
MQSTRPHAIFLMVPIIFILVSLTACSDSKHGIYDMVMGMERRQAGVEASILKVDDFDIAVCEGKGRGERPTLVMVHGFGANKAVWFRLCRHLKDDFHLVVRPSRPWGKFKAYGQRLQHFKSDPLFSGHS